MQISEFYLISHYNLIAFFVVSDSFSFFSFLINISITIIIHEINNINNKYEFLILAILFSNVGHINYKLQNVSLFQTSLFPINFIVYDDFL